MNQQQLPLTQLAPFDTLALAEDDCEILLQGMGHMIDRYKLASQDKEVVKKILDAFPNLVENHGYLLK